MTAERQFSTPELQRAYEAQKPIEEGNTMEATERLPVENGSGQVPALHEAEPTSLMEVISRASRDPSVDVDKLERLLGMAERLEARQAKAAYTKALVEMKPMLPVIDRNGRIEVREKTSSGKRDGDLQQSTAFAKWEDIDEAITPILARHGFVLSFRPGTSPDGKIAVTGILSHRDGHSEEATVSLPHDSTGSKNPVQAVGSSISYGKRYAATSLLNIRTRGEDDDGKAADEMDEIDERQVETIFGLIQRFGVNKDDFVKFMGVEAVPAIKRGEYDKAIRALNLKGKAMNKPAGK